MYSGVRTELSRQFPHQPKAGTGNGVVVAAGGIHMPLLAQDRLVAGVLKLDEQMPPRKTGANGHTCDTFH